MANNYCVEIGRIPGSVFVVTHGVHKEKLTSGLHIALNLLLLLCGDVEANPGPNDNSDDKILEQPALGRPMQLGMLYDCRNDTVIPGLTLWDPDVLSNNCNVKTQQGTQFDIITSDNISDKSAALKIEGELKASFLGGLVKVGGSAKYINDTKKVSRQSRVSLQYKTTVRFEQLTMKHFGRQNVQHRDIFDRDVGTHVVTGILYGAQAFFVFDRFLEEEKFVKNVDSQVSAMIKKIPCNHVGGKGGFNLLESEQAEADKLQCKFYGDFALKSNPSNYREAVNTYTQLPSMLGEQGENAVPLTVWLYPLSKLDTKASKLVREISRDVIGQIQNIFEGLQQLTIKCYDLGENNMCTDFPTFQVKINLFKTLLLNFKQNLQEKFAKALPKIRKGEEQENHLLDIITNFTNSPFNLQQLQLWVERKKKEMNFVKMFMKSLKSLKFIRVQDDLDELGFNSPMKHILAFSFSSIGRQDQYLSALSLYLASPPVESYSQQKEWFENAATTEKMKMKAKQLTELAAANEASKDTIFAVMGFDNGEGEVVDGGSIFLYENGSLITKDFQPPSTPGRPHVLEMTHDSVTIQWAPPKFALSCVTAYLVKYREKQSTQDQNWRKQRVESSTTKTIRDLRPNTEYEFWVAASCGISQYGKVSDGICETTNDSNFSEPVEIRTVDERWSREVFSKCDKVTAGRRPIYALRLTEHEVYESKYRVYSFENRDPSKRHVVIMLLGETGEGKSTLINRMINYIFGVKWENHFRLKIIADEGENKSNPSESQTQLITSYTINPTKASKVEYTLTIIDTPGFGSTSGIKADADFRDQMRQFFLASSKHCVDHVDVIGFVIKAERSRLTATQRYIFDSVLTMFGKDIKKNIIMLFTHAGTQPPQVINVIRSAKIPYSNTEFTFNNCNLYEMEPSNFSSKETAEKIKQAVWDDGDEHMQAFFQKLKTIEPSSLSLTKEVLKERQRLETSIQGLRKQVKTGCRKLEELDDEHLILEQHRSDIERNSDFTYELNVEKRGKTDVSDSATNCTRCEFTCHHPCIVPFNVLEFGCEAMSYGKCTVCREDCPWYAHVKDKFVYTTYMEKEERTSSEIKARYNDAKKRELTYEQIVNNHKEEFLAVECVVGQLIKKAHKIIKRLEEIALRPNPISIVDYVDLLIDSENKKASPGWKARVRLLESIRDQTELLTDLRRGTCNPFKQYAERFLKVGIAKSKYAFDSLFQLNLADCDINFPSEPE